MNGELIKEKLLKSFGAIETNYKDSFNSFGVSDIEYLDGGSGGSL
jgi:hypothetical protein